jgi:hypothetical protein
MSALPAFHSASQAFLVFACATVGAAAKEKAATAVAAIAQMKDFVMMLDPHT